MANVITFLQKEIEKGNQYMNCGGESVSLDKITSLNQKSYVALLKAGEIPFTKSFNEFHSECMECFVPIESIIQVIKDTIKTPDEAPSDCMPTPENTENVAI